MNDIQEEKLVDIISDFLIGSKEKFDGKRFLIKAYLNNNNTIIPIRFMQDAETVVDHIVVDFFNQERLENCEGITVHKEFIRLGCDLANLNEKGYINYYLDPVLTDRLNEKFNLKNP